MGQTLTHGVYLPDEGERNCYSGLAANWQILDTSVGTIAEHTSALAGKAPLVHTHTKSDITDFPAYGNAAGTICEGNDSRLSDARTPVAHTHTKSDVTDLFNSANVWGSIQTISYAGSNVAIALKNQETDIVASPTRNNWHYINFYDKNSVALGGFNYSKRTTGNSRVYLNLRTKNTNNDIIENNIFFETNQGGTDWNLYPSLNAGINLGTSTNKWKTFNGINPGALSLPNYSDTTYIDISGSIVPPSGETEINKNLGPNEYTPPVDGWLSIRCDGATFLQIYRNAYNCPGVTSCDPDGAKLVVTLPVRKNVTYTIRIKTSGTTNIYQLYPCLGNV